MQRVNDTKVVLSPSDVEGLLQELVRDVSSMSRRPKDLTIYGVPRGGIPVALAVAARLDGRLVDRPEDAWLIVDDLLDSGATRARYLGINPNARFVVLVDKVARRWVGQWVVFPWEVSEEQGDGSADDIVTRLLQFIGEDPNREGLKETPRRVIKAWREWAQGYQMDPTEVLKTFVDGAEGVSEMVVVHNIPIISKCEHHLADIMGLAHIAYIPNGRIVGLSKLPRVADMFARRLQVQERLTNQIANALDAVLAPIGVGVIIRASHACMSTRGVKIHGSTTTTSAMRGALLAKPEARTEFLHLCSMAERDR